MAKKSKTQRAKASAARQARKEARDNEELTSASKEAVESTEAPKKKLFGKSSDEGSKSEAKQAKSEKKEAAKPKKARFQFLKDVRSEMKRVTWPSKQDVARWSLVVVVALLFFGVYVAVLDNAIITPILYGVSGLGA